MKTRLNVSLHSEMRQNNIPRDSSIFMTFFFILQPESPLLEVKFGNCDERFDERHFQYCRETSNERTKWDLSIPDFEMPKKKRRRRKRRRREKTVTLIFFIFGKEEYAKNMLAREKKIWDRSILHYDEVKSKIKKCARWKFFFLFSRTNFQV